MASAEEPRYKLSLSLGMARFDPNQGGSLADLLSNANRAMYEKRKRIARYRKAGHERKFVRERAPGAPHGGCHAGKKSAPN